MSREVSTKGGLLYNIAEPNTRIVVIVFKFEVSSCRLHPKETADASVLV